ncbi:hypothetical protein DY023_14810 [Microbacterium bovistercoris]|uniref:Uncharacterized protein n=1 Tax=Microbacterium bovistercoris TaxID=2293570 RepID=A0A371NRA4_9MICO|nr:hypothetical protein [Microbacterium bovistercoris]REJ04692.1 hypothetical protein DY023_14810 [Microbacterium bovistercoris]
MHDPAEHHRSDEPADALWSRLRLIEGQPLADRAEAYSGLHSELMKRLDSAPKTDQRPNPAGER